jgi:carbon-monoxide dehydrogenase medium subunit
VDLESGRVGLVRIALGGAAPRPIRAMAAEAVLAGQLLDEEIIGQAARVAAQADAAPQDDQRASADYRRHLVAVLTERALADAASEKRRGLD